MLDPSQIRAITLDLDDTLWPVWPAIHRAEAALLQWLQQHAPATAQLFASTEALRAIRQRMNVEFPHLRHDLSGLRRASIAAALAQADDDVALAEPAFEVFFAARQQVDLYDDALPALQFLAARWPVVAVTNGNADVHRVGIGHFFTDSFNVQRTGVAKPEVGIFHAAAQALGVPPHQVLHVGDDAALDAVGARAAGMHAVWLNRSGIDWPEAQAPAAHTVRNLHQLCEALASVAPCRPPISPAD